MESSSSQQQQPVVHKGQTIRIYDLSTAATSCKVPQRAIEKWNALVESKIPTVHDDKDTRTFEVDIRLQTSVGELFAHAGQKIPSWRLGVVVTNPEAIIGEDLKLFTTEHGYAIDVDCVRYRQTTPFQLLRVGTSIQRQVMALHAACSAEGLQGALDQAPHMFCCSLPNHTHIRDTLGGAAGKTFSEMVDQANGFYEYQDPVPLVHGADKVAIPHNLFAGVTRDTLANSAVFLNTTEVLVREDSLIAHVLKMCSCPANKVYMHAGSGTEKHEQFDRARLYALHCSMEIYNRCCDLIMERSELVRKYGSFIFADSTLHIAPPFKEVLSSDAATVTLKSGAVLRYTDQIQVEFTLRITAAYYRNQKAICTVPISVGFWEDCVWPRKDYDFRSHSPRVGSNALPYPQSIDTVDKEARELMQKYLAVAQLPKSQLQKKRTRDCRAIKSIDDLPACAAPPPPPPSLSEGPLLTSKGKEEATEEPTEMEL